MLVLQLGIFAILSVVPTYDGVLLPYWTNLTTPLDAAAIAHVHDPETVQSIVYCLEAVADLAPLSLILSHTCNGTETAQSIVHCLEAEADLTPLSLIPSHTCNGMGTVQSIVHGLEAEADLTPLSLILSHTCMVWRQYTPSCLVWNIAPLNSHSLILLHVLGSSTPHLALFGILPHSTLILSFCCMCLEAVVPAQITIDPHPGLQSKRLL